MEGTRQEAARLGGERPGRVREAVAVRGQGRGGRPRGLRLAPRHVRVRKATSCLSPGGHGAPRPPPLEQMCSSLLPLRQGGRRLFVHANFITLTLLLFPILCQKEPHGIRRMF